MGFTREVVVKAPVEEVFEVVSNFKHAEEAMDHVTGVEILTDGPIGVGTEIKETRQIKKFEASSVLKVTEYEKNRRFVVQSEQNNLLLEYVYIFKEVKEGTRVEFEGKINTKGIRNRLMKPLITYIIKKEDSEHLNQMKKFVENRSDQKTDE
ncbi:SRPBCC family protein [Halalkalibacillus sediminis]|nr:SRPBCC family protein [Halalkalibacillus sediminis]